MKTKLENKTRLPPKRPTILRFSPTAWAKLLFLRDAGDTEIGGFGIAPANDLLFVEDIQLVKQTCTWITAEFDDRSIAELFDGQVDEGRKPDQFFRLFMHTHPGNSPEPSGTDEETFARVFGRTDWAVMFILARGGKSFARLRYNVGPGIDVHLPIEVDYSQPFEASHWDQWREEYAANVQVLPPEPNHESKTGQPPALAGGRHDDDFIGHWWRDAWGDYTDFDRDQQEAGYDYIDGI